MPILIATLKAIGFTALILLCFYICYKIGYTAGKADEAMERFKK